MVQMSTMMWGMGIFFAILGFLRGWNREVLATAGVVVAAFVLFQFDPLLRGWLLALAPLDQVFLVQLAIFMAVVFYAYRTQALIGSEADREPRRSLLTSLLGALMGFINGYLIWGVIWYLLDINQYPLAPLIIAPGDNSPSAQLLNAIPLVLISGGLQGTGDLFAIIVLLLFFLAIAAL